MNTRKLQQGGKNGMHEQKNGHVAAQECSHPLRLKILPALLASSFGVAGLLLPGMSVANPQGAQVVAGQATFNQQGNVLTIANSPNAIINWQNFSINANEITRFIQQNGDSAVLNRIIGQNPSQILGSLQSNGKVYLLNPNGILFGRGAQINVNGLVASSLALSDQDFLSGKRHFVGSPNAGSVNNEGIILAGKGGQVHLIAPMVENSGIISAPNGDLLLAAGHSVKLADANNPDISVVLSNPTSLAQNLGQMVAESGRIGIYGTLVRQAGRVSADSAALGENGKIIFKASRDTLLDKDSHTSSKGVGKGGEIQVLGDRVALLGNATVDVSGNLGGGTILVGGDMHGSNAQVQNANRAIFDRGAVLRADAGQSGDGGKIVLWSDGHTNALGTISAKGGSLGGNGGLVETSGKKTLDFHAKVNVGASAGKGGTLLLDPATIELVGGVGDGATNSDGNATFKGGSNPAGTVLFADTDLTTAGISKIYQSELEGLTAGINIILEATDYIHTSGDFTGDMVTLPNNSNLTLRTRNSNEDGTGSKGIDLTSSSDGANLKFLAQGIGSITLETGKGATPQMADILLPKLETAQGTITIDGTGTVNVGTGIFTSNKAISITGSKVVLADSSTINAGTATIALTAKGNYGIEFGTAASLNVGGAELGTGIHIVADYIDLLDGAINAGVNRRVAINPYTNTHGLDIVSTKSSSHLELTPAELNNIAAGDLTFNSFATTRVSTPTSLSQVKRIGLFGPVVSIQDALTNTTTDGSIFLNASSALEVGANGSVSRTGDHGRIEMVGDSIILSAAAAGAIKGGSGAVTISPYTNSLPIELRGNSRGGVLAITPDDLSKVSASIIEVGSGNLNWDGGTTVVGGSFSTPYTGQLSLFGGASTGNLTIDGALETAGNLVLTSEKLLKVSSTGSIDAKNIVLKSDQIQLHGAAGSVDSGTGTTWIVPVTVNTDIDLGSTSDSTANTLELSDAELGTISGSGTLRIGVANEVGFSQSGNLHVSSAIAPVFGGVLALEASKAITQSSTGSITANKLGLQALEGVDLTMGNHVNHLAATVGDNTHQGYNFKFKNNQALNLATNLDTHAGILVSTSNSYDPVNPAGVISLVASGALTQSTGGLIGGNALYAEGSHVDLTQANPVGVVAGYSTGTAASDMWHYASTNPIFVTTVAGQSGIRHDGAADAMSICLKAGSGGITQDANAPLISMAGGGVYFDTNGHVTFASNTNNVGIIFGENTGAFTFINSSSLTLGGANLGIKTTDHSIVIKSGGTLSIAKPVVAGSASVLLEGKNIDIGSHIKGSAIELTAKQSSGLIKTTQAVNIGDNTSTAILLQADQFDFSGGTPTITTTPSVGLLGFVNYNDDQAMTIDSKMVGNFVSPKILFGNNNTADSNTTTSIAITAPLTFSNSLISISGTGAITQSAPIVAQGLGARGASVILNAANQLSKVAAETTGGEFALTNTGFLTIDSFGVQQATLDGIKTNNGNVTIDNTGGIVINQPIDSGNGDINILAHSPLTVNAAVTSTTGSILLEAGSSGSTSDILTVSSTGSVNTSGTITLKAGAAVNLVGAVSGTPTILANLNPPPVPTIDQCVENPNLAGCSSVLPTLSQCITNPAAPGCSVILPSLTQCIANPDQSGCTVVLPTLSQCTSTPTLPGCSVVLPNLSACIATPTLPGCSVVLPNLTACIATPTLPGCSVVLPNLTACIATPTLPGCSVVLPNLTACIATPTLPGCSVVLPNLTACIATPTLPGCSVVLPNLTACIATPTLPGCSVILPNLTACIATPTLPGCSVVLPNLTACIATPTLPGCSVVLPNLTACIATPSLPGCSVVLPNLTACIATPTLPGCSAVLPNLTACIATPTLPGCSVVLPNLTACIATPTLPGCSAILPSISSCIATPTLPGCSVTLPNLTACIATPSLPGCSVVLPNITACTATPNLPGCSAVLPSLAQCTSNPALPGCTIVLPPTQQQNNEPVSQALNETVKVINNVTSKTEAIAPPVVTAIVSASADEKSSTASGTSSTSGSTDVKTEVAAKLDEKKDEKKDEKQDDKKETVVAKETAVVKKEEPAKKLYCN